MQQIKQTQEDLHVSIKEFPSYKKNMQDLEEYIYELEYASEKK